MGQAGGLAFFGGLAMFIFGMYLMRSGVEQAGGARLQQALQTAAGSFWRGFLTGLLVTAVIQSSTATVLLCVGLVSAGAMCFRQSAGVVLGANVGTTATAQIIRLMDSGAHAGFRLLQVQQLAPLLLIGGVVLLSLPQRRSRVAAGLLLGGLGSLFYGLLAMQKSAAPVLQTPAVSALLQRAVRRQDAGFLLGFLGAAGVQSSSAAVGILQTLCAAGELSVTAAQAYPILLGMNMGAALSAMGLGWLGAKGEGRKTAVVFFLINALGLLADLAVMALLPRTLTDRRLLDAGGIASLHTFLRLISAAALLPCMEWVCRLTDRMFSAHRRKCKIIN